MGEHYGQLSLAERVYLQAQLELGFKAAAIAAALKREPSTIGHELRRNGWKRSAMSQICGCFITHTLWNSRIGKIRLLIL